MSKRSAGLCLMWLVLVISSCHTGRKAARRREVVPADTATLIHADNINRAPADTVAVQPSSTAAEEEKQKLVTALLPLWNRHLAYNTFSGKAKVHYEGKGQKQDFAANIRMERDKKIWVSITALGMFEVARALITPDSIMLIDRLHKEVHILPFAEAGKLLPVSVDFATLQNLIIGDALRTGNVPTDATDFGGGLSLGVTGGDYEQQITYNKTDSTIRQQQLKGGGPDAPSLMIQYGEYSLTDGRLFSGARVINVQDKGDQHYIDMQFNKVDFDQSPDFSFSIPSKYTRK